MNCFTNVQMNVVPGMLSETDLDLLQATISEVFVSWQLAKKQEGSFALVGQKRGELPREILRFNFCDGRKMKFEDSRWDLYAGTSDRAVETAIDELLRYPHEDLSCDYHPDPTNFGQLSSGIYYVGKPRAYAVVINTTFGRFLASTSIGKNDVDLQILTGAALAIRYCSGPEDKAMADSVDHCIIPSAVNESAAQRIGAILNTVVSNLEPAPAHVFFE